LKIRALPIPEVKLITPTVFSDDRGRFSETFVDRALQAAGIERRFVQDNHSVSVPRGVVRGLHFQAPPRAQDKLVRVVRGSIFDVAVDLRVGSPTFGQHASAVLSASDWTQILVPRGFAHGFCTLEPDTEVLYKVTDYYAPECDRGLRWDDPALGIAWPVTADEALLSAKDRQHPGIAELPAYFRYEPSVRAAREIGAGR
jgi:dTDP-4-dehydrorhamnose 3,5-epimerase